VSTTQWG